MAKSFPDAKTILKRFRNAREARQAWEPVWKDAYDLGLPQRGGFAASSHRQPGHGDRLFDGTAPDAVDQLAAVLLAKLTPPWSRWFGLDAGPEVPEEELEIIGAELDIVAETLQSHFDRSNFVVEAHQAYLDLVTGGTGSLLFEEADPGEPSAFRFAAIPLTELYVEEGASGRLDTTYRRVELPAALFRERFPDAKLPRGLSQRLKEDSNAKVPVVEAVVPHDGSYAYIAVLERTGDVDAPRILKTGRFDRSPFINFRWMKAPGESYGRSPVVKALPDIKTANKVVELILKNASISVTGIWQADDDGVLNPANIQLVPGTIIPKAVGSQGLTPLASPGEFDVSQLILEDLRARIRHALLADRLGQVKDPRMTATEILERADEMARLLGATFGRLQVELLRPLIDRGIAILRRRKEIPDIHVDGRIVELVYRSPLAQEQGRKDVANVRTWLETIAGLGPEAMAAVDVPAAARWFGRTLGVPSDIMKPAVPPTEGGEAQAGSTPVGAAPPVPAPPNIPGLEALRDGAGLAALGPLLEGLAGGDPAAASARQGTGDTPPTNAGPARPEPRERVAGDEAFPGTGPEPGKRP